MSILDAFTSRIYVYEADPFAVSPFYLHYLFIRISFIHLFFIFVCFFRQKNVTIKRLKKKTVFFFGMLYSFPCAVFTDLYFLLARYCRPFSSNPSNGRLYPARCLQKNKNKLNDTCTVRCNPGFIPRFSSLQTLTCYSNGFWSRTRITECVRKYHVHSRLGPLCSHCAIVK